MSELVKNVVDSDFEKEVTQSTGLVLVDFWAPWCGPCRQLSPIIEDLASQYSGSDKVKFVKVNVDDAIEVASRLGIRSIPTLILFKNGKNIDTKVGVLSKASIIEWIDSND